MVHPPLFFATAKKQKTSQQRRGETSNNQTGGHAGSPLQLKNINLKLENSKPANCPNADYKTTKTQNIYHFNIIIQHFF